MLCLCVLGVVFLSLTSIVLADDIEDNILFNWANPKEPPDKVAVQGGSVVDEIPKVITPWGKKKDGNSDDKSEDIKPVNLDNNVVRMLPEQAMRAIIDGDFIAQSIQAVGRNPSKQANDLANVFIAFADTSSYYTESIYQTQKLANDRLLSAYKAYRAMQKTQLDGDNMAQKEAVRSLNSCLYNEIKTKRKSWITAFYYCMGEGDPTQWKEKAKGVQAVSRDFNKYQLTQVQGGDLWSPQNHPVYQNKKYQEFLEVARAQAKATTNGKEYDKKKILSVDGLIFFGSKQDNINNNANNGGNTSASSDPSRSWLELFGDYFIIFDEEDHKVSEGEGRQIKELKMVYVKTKKSFREMYEEVHKNRFKDLGKVLYKICQLRYVENAITDDDMTDEKSPRKVLIETDETKKAIWNLSVPEKKLSLFYIQSLLKSYSEKFDTNDEQGKICENWKEIAGSGQLSNQQKNSNVKDELKNAENYTGFVTTSQLLHMIIVAENYVRKISAGITNLPADPLVMARKMVLNATMLESEPFFLLDENFYNWELSDSLISTKAAQKSGESLKSSSSDSKALTSKQ